FDTYAEEIEYLKSWTADRLQWMDQQMLEVNNVSYIPNEYHLYDAYPNPFNPVTTLRYDLPQKSMVTIKIYDMLGREVNTIVNQVQDAGFQSIIWDGTSTNGSAVAAGIYLYQIQTEQFTQTKKMVFLK
ncbi:MAG: T9SS type A sorting domain-containing protein, partial [Candidatus Neomarinimicrobiota bacterium]|nr:T9SS type A sorting domain-containing protein [Candidatus Neomarinimicrobiota bacterium]